jgi:hypothetical protein
MMRRHWVWIPWALTALVLAFAIKPAGANMALAVECDIEGTTNTGSWFAGGRQTGISNLQGSSAVLDYYNPAPLFGGTNFWTMVTDGSDYYAQVGWMKYEDHNGHQTDDSVVFAQLDQGVGKYKEAWWVDNGVDPPYWSMYITDAVTAGDEKLYEIYEFNGKWWISYDYNTSLEVTKYFTPDDVEVFSEIHREYESNFPWIETKGDHIAGDTVNTVEANSSKKNQSGTWYNTALNEINTTDVGDLDMDGNTTGDGFEVWDNRCSS